ncbi:ABC transporter ATP-binding protein [Actinoplanes sp. NEAU-A12]|uniref:ABC transporter ATP-binding protein n=1 Tax=Actinoplanes sandaracinus TaxID=3045177 RepID=A0ABT6WPP3_9ACTN|nr:ABC transporter ATP-binding protein [Actinoplanes sandaracinus]MDI6101683.1 ABC transporter ATP-binding protein [Actinoplanes sandaracinus]
MLRLSRLSVRFADRVVVDDVDLAVGPGEAVGLIGGSGSGKTLTALGVLGLLPATAHATGSITVDGAELCGAPERRLRRVRGSRVGFIGQDALAALNPLATVGRHLRIPLRGHRGLSRREAAQECAHLLDRVGLPAETATAYPAQLSGGQRQRVAIALAAAGRPGLLIADEPTSALDPLTQAGVLGLLRDLPPADGGARPALLLISHDLAVVSQVCTRLAVMHAGRLVEEGDTAEVIAAPRHPYTRALVASARALAA